VINANVGIEMYATDTVIASVGAYTDISAHPAPSDGEANDIQTYQLDRYGLTTGLTFLFGPIDFTVGASYVIGDGKYVVGKDLLNDASPERRRVPMTEHQITAFITGGVSFGDAIKPIADASALPLQAAAGFFTQKEPLHLKPGDVHPNFSAWAGGALDDLKTYVTAKGAVPGIAYERVGVADYDRFFKEAAVIEGALVIAGGRLKRIRSGIKALKKAAQGVVTGVQIATSDTDALRLVGAYATALHTIDMKKALKGLNRDRKVALKAMGVLIKQAPKTLRLGVRLLSEAPNRFRKEGVSALAGAGVALRNAIRMVRRFKRAIGPIGATLRSLWPRKKEAAAKASIPAVPKAVVPKPAVDPAEPAPVNTAPPSTDAPRATTEDSTP